MEENNKKVQKQVKTPIKIGLVEFLLVVMACMVIALGAVFCILN